MFPTKRKQISRHKIQNISHRLTWLIPNTEIKYSYELYVLIDEEIDEVRAARREGDGGMGGADEGREKEGANLYNSSWPMMCTKKNK